MEKFFKPRSVAVIGASSKPNKVGNVVFTQVQKKFKTYPINSKGKKILGKKSYKSILDVKGKIDLAVIAIPARFVISVLEECAKKGVKNVIIISSGFKEIGNEKLEKELYNTLEKYHIKCVGPNCLGIFDAHSGLDTLFLPEKKLTRPSKGGISFISQSGAVGSTILDIGAYQGLKFAKFISYGNGTNLSESDLLEYLGKDKQTNIICMYLEGIKDGRKFLEVAKKISKPIIVIKAGKSQSGVAAAMSHTGSLAGSYAVHQGAFKQADVILVNSLKEMLDTAKLFQNLSAPKNKNIEIITNGGGFGIMATDAFESQRLKLGKIGSGTKKFLEHRFSKMVSISNPLDLLGDVTNEGYEIALRGTVRDRKIGVIVVIVLIQTPLIDKGVINIIKKYQGKKPIVPLLLGGAQTKKAIKKLESFGFPVFEFPEDAAIALKYWLGYY
jgi:acetate---CoA ligase (ADP-forming)